jgi:flagellar hook-basal body complex protein FliE
MIEGVTPLNRLGEANAATAAPATTTPSAGTSFEDALGQTIGAAIDTLKTGEATAIQGVEGAAPPMRVVESIMDAQRSLQSVLAVRDKLVSAWQDVSRMTI